MKDLKPSGAPIVLEDEVFDKVMEVIENPPAPTKAMKEIIELSSQETFTISNRDI